MRQCPSSIPGGFSKKACMLWMSFLNLDTRYFEWGSGFTTRTADNITMRVTSIEGSSEWYRQMKEHTFSERTTLRYIDIGKTGAFSYPEDPKKGKKYIHAINSTQDVILVDGRWRVACAASAFPFIAPTGRLMVHDFSRKYYHSLLKVYDKETEVDELAVLTPKPNVSTRELQKLMHEFKKNPIRL